MIPAKEFLKLLQSGDIKAGKRGRFTANGRATAAIGQFMEQEASQSEKTRHKRAVTSVPKAKKEAKQLSQMKLWLHALGYKPVFEHVFHPTRKWRFDIAFPERKIAIEYEGINSKKSRHTTLLGYTGDTEKYNEAHKLGWRVFRYTALNYEKMISDVESITDLVEFSPNQ